MPHEEFKGQLSAIETQLIQLATKFVIFEKNIDSLNTQLTSGTFIRIETYNSLKEKVTKLENTQMWLTRWAVMALFAIILGAVGLKMF
jgi:hypothetical protein